MESTQANTAKSILILFKDTALKWQADNGPRMAAALAFYTIFSLAPVLIIMVAITGRILGPEAARGAIVGQIRGFVGLEAAQFIQTAIQEASHPAPSRTATLIGIGTMLLGASYVFMEVQDALNKIWGIGWESGNVLSTIKSRFFAFALFMGIGLLLLVYIVISTAVSVAGAVIADSLPAYLPTVRLVRSVEFVISVAVITFLFAIIYKVLPEVNITWRDVWLGSAATAVLFVITKLLLGFYLSFGTVGSAYGAAGSLLVILFWIYFSGLIFFFGAAFTEIYAYRFGSRRPARIDTTASAEDGTLREEEGAVIQAGRPAGAENASMASPFSPILNRHAAYLPPVLRDLYLLPTGATYQVVLEGQVEQIRYRRPWLRPVLSLLDRTARLLMPAGGPIPATVTISTGCDEENRPCHVWRHAFGPPVEDQFLSRMSYHAESGAIIEDLDVSPPIQLLWSVHFKPPLTLRMAAVACLWRFGRWQWSLPRWLWLAPDLTLRAEAAHAGALDMALVLTHPLFGEVFAYSGRFQQRLEPLAEKISPAMTIPS